MARRPTAVEAVVIDSADGPIVAHVFPTDVHFARDIRRAATDVEVASLSEADARAAMESHLREWYPKLEIRPREELAGLGVNDVVWYVIRDGRLGRTRERIDHMHAVLSDARDTEAAAEIAIRHAQDAISLAATRRPWSRRHDAIGDTGGTNGHEDGDADSLEHAPEPVTRASS